MVYIFDKRTILGIGIGLVIGSILMLTLPKPQVSEADIIKMARDRGMVFQDEVKSLFDD